jgi:hypothetical protein
LLRTSLDTQVSLTHKKHLIRVDAERVVGTLRAANLGPHPLTQRRAVEVSIRDWCFARSIAIAKIYKKERKKERTIANICG